MTKLEICCGDLGSVLAAKEGGATRIELCSGLSDGGITPSQGLIKAAVESGIPEVNVLIRPRPGDFLYTGHETALMEADIKAALALGANGVVIGALTADGDIDTGVCQRLVKTARLAAREAGCPSLNITFHRAFDMSRDGLDSLEAIISLGCDCLLTSGMEANAAAGTDMLRRLVDVSRGRITIMAGAGVNTSNAAAIISGTGVGAIHSTARRPIASGMRYRRHSVSMGTPGADEYAMLTTDPTIVAHLRAIANENR